MWAGSWLVHKEGVKGGMKAWLVQEKKYALLIILKSEPEHQSIKTVDGTIWRGVDGSTGIEMLRLVDLLSRTRCAN